MAWQGEGSPNYGGGGISSTNVGRLRQDPSGRINSASFLDDDGKASTFGKPNTWTLCPTGATATQSFAGLPEAGCVWSAPNPADLNGDGHVDGADLGIMLASWGQTAGPTPADLNTDGVVNGADIGALLGAWNH